MSNSEKVVVPNYSKKQVSELENFGTHNLESAKFFAEKFGKSYQSIISKVKNLDLDYEKKAPPVKKAVQTTKTELVSMLEAKLDRNLDGLSGATRNSLLQLINGVAHATHVPDKD